MRQAVTRIQIWIRALSRVIAWTRQQGLVLYIGDRGCSSPTRRWSNRSWEPFILESAIDFDTPSSTKARRPPKSRGSITCFGYDTIRHLAYRLQILSRNSKSGVETRVLPDLERECVTYCPSTEPSIKRCTCVNKRKNSGNRWTLENNITRCLGGSSQLETGCRSENQLQTEGVGPLVTLGWAIQAKTRKKCCYGRERNWVNIAVRPCLHSFLTHNKHHFFENKVWEIYIKKCI